VGAAGPDRIAPNLAPVLDQQRIGDVELEDVEAQHRQRVTQPRLGWRTPFHTVLQPYWFSMQHSGTRKTLSRMNFRRLPARCRLSDG
jgi:hypothetical protein